MKLKLLLGVLSVATLPTSSMSQEQEQPQIGEPDVSAFTALSNDFTNNYTANSSPDRKNYFIPKSKRGDTVDIPIADIVKFCGDRDGCQLRLGMHDWDGTGRVASRTSQFYYNKTNRNWRGEHRDLWGQDQNNNVEHVFYEWGCFVTDSKYVNSQWNDSAQGFGLLSWTTWNADCVLTIVD